MTKKIYTTAQGKSVDLGAIILQNEHVRAVGNMNVNARGDLLDGSSRVIDTRNQQVSRQMERTTQPAVTGVAIGPRHTSSVSARRARADAQTAPATQDPVVEDIVEEPEVQEPEVQEPAPVDAAPAEPPLTGLAAAMARSRTVTQEKLKTPKEIAKNRPGVTKL
jgi:hypothetical protein